MRYALHLAEDGRILSVTRQAYGAPGDIFAESFPKGASDYRYIDGEFLYDPLPREEAETAPTIEEQVAELREALDLLLSGVTE